MSSAPTTRAVNADCSRLAKHPVFAAYDGNRKRAKAVVNGKTLYNVYDASGSLVHIDAVTDGSKTDYVAGPQGTLARIENNVVTYLHPDYLGSAQSGTNSAGTVVWREQYTPFGEELQGSTANDDQAGYTGHIKDQATGLNYMQARYYDPTIGRFLSVDPVGFTSGNPMSFNRYSYVANDPLSAFDPEGLATVVTLKANPIGKAPFVGTYGHSFVHYRDTETGETRISRAGPSAPYPGGSSDAIGNKAFDGVTIEAIDTPASESIDNGQPGTVDVATATVDADIGAVRFQLESFNEDVNAAGAEYRPKGQNSNTYAGDAFQRVTGQEPANNTDIKLPGLKNDLPIDDDKNR